MWGPIRLALAAAIAIGMATPALGVAVEWRVAGDGTSLLAGLGTCQASPPGRGCAQGREEGRLRGRLRAEAQGDRFTEVRGTLVVKGGGKLVVTHGEIQFSELDGGWVGQLITSTHGRFAFRTPPPWRGMPRGSGRDDLVHLFGESIAMSSQDSGALALVLRARVVAEAKLRSRVDEAPFVVLVGMALGRSVGRRLTPESERA